MDLRVPVDQKDLKSHLFPMILIHQMFLKAPKNQAVQKVQVVPMILMEERRKCLNQISM
ncbi:hypothetical protein MPTA6425_4050 [Mycoplasmoides pneumoniae]|nr:hypothetical protein Y1241N_3090 [Mycoplasmoides pneumoniae]GLL60745.1 hypothetical protein OA571N_6300 [Mycoplasmoides pneumoniae]GLL61150.1 hypothetical protein OA631U_3140 [Mycoplasmoides pneumoniae]